MRHACLLLTVALAGCSASAAPTGWRHAHVERLPARRAVAIRNVEVPFPKVTLPPSLKSKRAEPLKPLEPPKPKDEPKTIEVPRPKVEPKAEPLTPLEPPKPKPVEVSQPKASEPKADPKPPAAASQPPPQPDWHAAPGREGIEVYSAPSGPVQAWRFRGDTTHHTGSLPPSVGLRQWYTLSGYPGLEGYGLLGPKGVTVEKWRYAGQTQEYTGWPPAVQSPVPYLTVPRYSFGGGS